MSLKFGLSLPQGWIMDLAGIKDPVEAYETMTRVAQTADEVGFESAWLVDHFHTIPQPSQEVTFECWTTTAAVARDTKRIRIGQAVTCNGYRNPALLAKMASTVDVLSHGRLNFGIGAGWYEHEYRAYGYDYPEAPERLRHLREAVQVILAMWTQQEAVFEGKYYQVRGAINQPKGVQKPHIPLLIGGGGEQVTLPDGSNAPASLVGSDAGSDIAVLRVDWAGADIASRAQAMPAAPRRQELSACPRESVQRLCHNQNLDRWSRKWRCRLQTQSSRRDSRWWLESEDPNMGFAHCSRQNSPGS